MAKPGMKKTPEEEARENAFQAFRDALETCKALLPALSQECDIYQLFEVEELANELPRAVQNQIKNVARSKFGGNIPDDATPYLSVIEPRPQKMYGQIRYDDGRKLRTVSIGALPNRLAKEYPSRFRKTLVKANSK